MTLRHHVAKTKTTVRKRAKAIIAKKKKKNPAVSRHSLNMRRGRP